MFLLKPDAFWGDEGGPPSNASQQASTLCDLGTVAQLFWEGNLQRGQITWKLP